MIKTRLNKELEKGIINNWENDCLANYKAEKLTYKDVAEKIVALHTFFAESNIKKGDKIALLGKNSVNWAITFLSTITYGAVIVPILPDFHSNDVHHIINHSEAKLFFTSDKEFERFEHEEMPKIKSIISSDNLEYLSSKKNSGSIFAKLDIRPVSRENFKVENISNDKLAALIYTSGTTGFSKGVLLPHNSLISNIVFAQENMPLKSKDKILSFMPLAHSYACSFEFLFPFTLGCFITFLNKTPSPKVILKAFSEIKPNLILSVPLIIEKIYRKKLKPVVNKPIIKFLRTVPGIKNLLNKKIKKQLDQAFGGNFFEIVVGGAPLNKEVSEFFREIGFHFTVGYGMTECGPLISYSGWKHHKLNSVGKKVDQLEVKIDSDDPQNVVGEILVKGENVMDGYYKNQEATDATIDENGWLHTGDLGVIDSEGNIFIKGRSKSMILGPSGQNIYPEEIQAKLDNLSCVQESLVIDRNGKLIALVYPDYEAMDALSLDESKLAEVMQENLKILNKNLQAYSQVSKIELYPEEFEKTPTKKIKRFLYANK